MGAEFAVLLLGIEDSLGSYDARPVLVKVR